MEGIFHVFRSVTFLYADLLTVGFRRLATQLAEYFIKVTDIAIADLIANIFDTFRCGQQQLLSCFDPLFIQQFRKGGIGLTLDQLP
jgi:hypothetical protein